MPSQGWQTNANHVNEWHFITVYGFDGSSVLCERKDVLYCMLPSFEHLRWVQYRMHGTWWEANDLFDASHCWQWWKGMHREIQSNKIMTTVSDWGVTCNVKFRKIIIITAEQEKGVTKNQQNSFGFNSFTACPWSLDTHEILYSLYLFYCVFVSFAKNTGSTRRKKQASGQINLNNFINKITSN